MLTDVDRELITAAVDGDLPPDRVGALHALLAREPAAVTLLARLKADSRRLRELPRRPAPAGLAEAVAARVAALPRANPYTPYPEPVRPGIGRSRWVPYAVAASLLLAVTAASYWVTLLEVEEDRNADRLAQQQRLPRPHDLPDRLASSSAAPAEASPELVPVPRRALPADGNSDDSRLAVLPRPADAGPEAAPLPRPTGVGDLVGSRLLVPIPPLESVEARLPVLAAVPDLDRKEVLDRMASELGREPAFRLDLFVKDVPRAVTTFQSAARTAGLVLAVEATAQDRLRKKLPTALAVYSEALTPEEVVKFLAVLARRDRSDKSGAVFTTAHLVPAQAADQRDLRDLFGLDLGLGKRRVGGAKPTAPGTAAEKDRDTKTAIVLTYMPAPARVSPSASREVKAFLDRRAERKPPALALLIVIRPVL